MHNRIKPLLEPDKNRLNEKMISKRLQIIRRRVESVFIKKKIIAIILKMSGSVLKLLSISKIVTPVSGGIPIRGDTLLPVNKSNKFNSSLKDITIANRIISTIK
jgi:hypothetical protein